MNSIKLGEAIERLAMLQENLALIKILQKEALLFLESPKESNFTALELSQIAQVLRDIDEALRSG
jgi:hypothetical protein